MEQEASRTSWVWTAAAGATVVGLAVIGMNGEPARSQETGKADRPAVKSVPRTMEKTAPAEVADPSFERYRGLLRRNPFAPKLPPPPVAVKPVTPEAPVLPPPAGAPTTEKPKEEVKKPETAAPPAPPAPPDPLKDWTYTGTVVFGDEVYAVLENKTSKRGEYVKTGGMFEGFKVELIAQSELRLNQAGGIRALAKSSAFNATPLNAPAGAPAGAPGPGGPGAPGGPMGPGGPGGPGARPSGGPMPAGARPAGPAAPVMKTAPAGAPAAGPVSPTPVVK